MKVAKFGGSSLANAEQIKKTCNIILSDPARRLIVVSAPGKFYDEDIKVTDMLIACVNAFLDGGDYEKVLQDIIRRFSVMADELKAEGVIEDIEKDIRSRLDRDMDPSKLMDSMKAAGEDNNARFVAAYLKSLGHDAKYLSPKEYGMTLSDQFGNAVVLDETYDNLSVLANIEGIGIFPGFFGFSKKGDIVTFPRGGSDITGAILAAAVKAEVYENFTDVDYVYSVSPKIVKNPKPMRYLSYREMRELSYSGFNVYQEEALTPVYRANVPINIRNVNNPSCEGSLILHDYEHTVHPVTGIASDNHFCCINIRKLLMNREIGYVRRILSVLEEEGVSFEHLPSGIDDITLIIKESVLQEGQLDRMVEKIQSAVQIDELSVEKDVSLIVIVGEKLLNNIGIAARTTKTFSDNKINIKMLSQGASEISMIFAVDTADCNRAIAALYHEFFD